MEENKSCLRIRIKVPKKSPPLTDSGDGWKIAHDEGESSFNGDAVEIANVDYPKSTSPTCPECGRTFPSDKSLFGHLRTHPERSYRGAHPPPMATKKRQYSEARDWTSKPPPSLPKWPTRKRSRTWPVVIVNVLQTAEGRIFKTKQMEVSELENAEPGACGRRYMCSVCMKSFSSHQALGGHKSSHRKCENTNPKEEAKVNVDLISHAASIYNSPEACGSECLKEATHDPSPSAHSCDQADHKKASYRVFDFDLNEIPKPEGEEES